MAATTSTAILAATFISSLGINTHVEYTSGPYSNRTNTINAINYLGLKNLRDSSQSSRSFTVWPQITQATGAKFIAYMPRLGPTDMQESLARIPRLHSLGVLNYIEGANEPDTPDALRAGNSISYSKAFQQQVFSMGRQLGLKVINMSPGAGWTSADGWQGNYDNIGNLAAYADFANAHTYPAVANGMPYKTVDRLNDLAQLAAIGRPVIISELGWNTESYSQATIAKNLLNGVMDAAFLNNPKTYIFALFDDVSGKWGVMNSDATPRAAGTAIRNLVQLLGDSGSIAPGSLTFELTGVSTERKKLFRKSDGSYWLALWDETAGARNITLRLTSNASSIRVYDPVSSTTAIQSVSNTSSIVVAVNDRPMLIRIAMGTAVSTPAPAPTPEPTPTPPPSGGSGGPDITSYASNTTINVASTTDNVRLYGTGVTLNGGTATYTLTALAGGNTVNAGSGQSTLHIAGASNRVNVNGANTYIEDSGRSSIIKLGRPGGGVAVISGYIFNQGSRLDLRTLMAATSWNGDRSIISRYLKLGISGKTAVLYVTPTGNSSGTTYVIAKLNDHPYLTLSTLLNNAILQ